MKLSTKGRYGLRAMLDLAVNTASEHVSLYSIAERQDVSVNYLEQVFSTLRKAGWVKSIKGAQGGYVLSDRPSRISVGDVLRSLEGDLSIVDSDDETGDALDCYIRANVWDKINDAINSVVDNLTLEDLMNDYRKIIGDKNDTYYI